MSMFTEMRVLSEADLTELELQAWAYATMGDAGLEALDELEEAELPD